MAEHWAKERFKKKVEAVKRLENYLLELESKKEKITYTRKADILEFPGVYYFVHDGKIRYIGSSMNVKKRVYTHRKYKPGELILVWYMDAEVIRWVEHVLIAAHKPEDCKPTYTISLINKYDFSEITGINLNFPSLRY